MTVSDDLKRKLESILFAAGRAVSLSELKSLLHVDEPGLIRETIRELREEYDDKQSSMMILSEGEDSWKLTVREGFLPLVRKINPHTELSKTMLETLAVIAWKQPALQSDVIKIRTNKAYDHIAELHRLGFVTKERHGRSYLLKVTQKFLDYFDLPDETSIKDVFKDFRDIEVAVQKKGKQLSEEEQEDEGAVQKKQSLSRSLSGAGEEDGNAPVGGEELKTYVDALPPMDMPGKPGLETYVDAPEVGSGPLPAGGGEEEDENGEDEIGSEDKGLSGQAGEDDRGGAGSSEESDEEKARRIARELVEGREPEQGKSGGGEAPESEGQEKKLHPELEEFIAGEEIPGTAPPRPDASPEVREDKEGNEEAKEEGKVEGSAAGREEQGSDVGQEKEIPGKGQTGSGPEPEPFEPGEGEDAPRQAEEYPGQFSEKSGKPVESGKSGKSGTQEGSESADETSEEGDAGSASDEQGRK